MTYQRAHAMASVKSWVMAALLALSLCPTAMGQAREVEADPSVWGVYARLVGTGWQGKFGIRTTRWGQGGQIIEDDSTFGQSVITPGPTLGTLSLELGASKLHTFQGTIASDGSVLWIRDGMIKMPYRVLLRDGELVEEAVKLNGREVASVKREMRYQQVDGPRVASRSTSGPIAEPTSASPAAGVSTADADASFSTGVVTATTASAPQTPAKAPASPVPTPTNLDGLKSMLGKMFLGGNETIEFPAGADVDVDNFTLRYGNYLDAETATFTFRASGQPGVYVVARHPADPNRTNYVGTVEADGTLLLTYQLAIPDGYTYAIRYQKNGTGLVQTRLALKKKWLSNAPEVTTQAVNEFRPYSPAGFKAQADWLVLERRIMGTPEEQAARQAREARQAKIESDQALGRAFNNMLGDLAQVNTGGYAEAQANLDATVANIQYAADVERQQQALARQQGQARAAEQRRQQLAENARWVAEKEQAAAEYRSGQVDAAAAREAQFVAQQQADQQRRAASEAQRRGAEQAAAVERQRLQAAALAEGPQISARPVTTAYTSSRSSVPQYSEGTTASPRSSGPIEMFAFFINLGGKTVAFEGPTAMTVAEGNAKKARLAAEAPGRYGAGATVKVQSMGNGYCAFVYQLPGKGSYVLGSDTDLSTTIEEKDGLVKNGKAMVHHDVVCPTNN